MAAEDAAGAQARSLSHYLSPLNVWALSLGCIVGWGAFVMPGTTLLPVAGPLGTLLAMLIGGAIMLAIAKNYSYMIQRYPDSGGGLAFTKRVLSYDHAFLCSWALVMAYVSIMWANATAFVLISRYLLGPVFQVGFHYQIAGYDIYAGEIALTLAVLWGFGLLSMAPKRVVKGINTVLAIVMLGGTVICCIIAIAGNPEGLADFHPAFAPGSAPGVEVFGIVALAPWAFIGFESVANGAGEFAFDNKRLFPIMALAIMAGALIYILTSVMSVVGTPPEYASWVDYINDLGNLDGIMGLPVYHAVSASGGQAALGFLAVVVIAAMSTSLLGLYRAGSRMFFASAEDGLLPSWFAQLNRDAVPRNAILFIMAISTVVPFVGRAAIGWIVDVTTVSAAIAYFYASVCSFIVARENGNRVVVFTAVVGMVASAIFLIYPLVPNFWSVSSLASESYLIIAAWSILGLVLFRATFQRDRQNRFGKSTVVWIAMIFLIFFASTMWMRQVTHETANDVVVEINDYYTSEYERHGIQLTPQEQQGEAAYFEGQTDTIRQSLLDNSLVQMVLIIFSLIMMFNIYALMRRREKEIDSQRQKAQDSSKAKTTFLSNMSHDIRTPMNAIIGYTHMAQRDDATPEEVQEYLEKIDGSSKHLLALINDVLEMSRIESGKLELEPEHTDLNALMTGVHDMFATQMREKGVTYTVDSRGLRESVVMCDGNRLNRVLLNLVSNAFKFTPEGGEVSVTLTQLSDEVDGVATYELRVKDTGIGMSPEFAAKVFEAFERERTSTVSGIQGTGLGMAITKNIIETMDGDIRVITAEGEGTEFIVTLPFEVVGEQESAPVGPDADDAAAQPEEVDFTGKRCLLVEDNELNREIALFIMEDLGFEVDEAVNGKEAVEKVALSEPGYYDVVLMDIQMPVMDGYEASREIRQLADDGLNSVPIVAVSANAFAEDVRASHEAGMNDHVPKPLDVDRVIEALSKLLK